jgi:molecular chaperone IbpA
MEKYPNHHQQWPNEKPGWPHETPKLKPAPLPVPTVTFTSLFNDQFFLGFNEQVERWQNLNKKAAFPPYNLVKVDKNTYRIELAVAGYSKEDIDVSVEKDLLTVKSKNNNSKSTDEFIHQGIAERDWTQSFVLGEWITVKDAVYKDGMLTISLEREVPEELKPKVIKIK